MCGLLVWFDIMCPTIYNMKFIGISEVDDTVTKPCIITPYFIVHAISGYWLASLMYTYFPSNKNKLLWVFLLHSIYELKDLYVSYVIKYRNVYTNNSWMNTIGDTFAAILGFYMYKTTPLSFKMSTVVFFIVGAIGAILHPRSSLKS